MSTNADVVARVLSDAGIEYIYGVPGSFSSIELIDAAEKYGIRYVLCSNEASAVVMASTYGVLTGKPGVCSTGLGPSAAAAILGVANAFLEYAPCLILTDRYSDEWFRRLKRQRLDHNALFRSVVKETMTLTEDSAGATIRRAIAIATEGRQGPVHVDLPFDVIQSEASPDAFLEPNVRESVSTHSRLDLDAALRAVEGAKRPIVIVGFQVSRSGTEAEQALEAFVRRLEAPVFTSVAAKGIIDESRHYAMGTFRGASREQAFLKRADLVVIVGLDVVELWVPGNLSQNQSIILLDEVPHSDGVINPDLAVIGTLSESLSHLAANIAPCRAWDSNELKLYKDDRNRLLYPSGDGLMPGAVVRIARERLPDDGVVTVDAGLHKVLVCDAWETRRPGGFHTSSGLGSMAVALPAATAAKMVEPRTAVLCITGDGGLLMRLGDLEVAAREQIAIVVLVFNDGYLNQIKVRQDERSLKRLGTKFRDSDYVSVAKGLGFDSVRVDTEECLDQMLMQAFNSGRPWLIDAHINPDGYLSS